MPEPGPQSVPAAVSSADTMARLKASGRLEPVWVPAPADIASSQLSAFMRHCELGTGEQFASYAAFEAFSIRAPDRFWSLLIEWSELLCSGEMTPAITSAEVEHARFFPSLRLNYAENLLRLDGDATAPSRPAVTEVRADGSLLRWSRSELRDRVASLSAAFLALGLGPTDRVALIAHNTADAVATALAASSIGCAVSTLTPELGTTAVQLRLQRIAPVLVMIDLSASAGPQAHQQAVRAGEALRGLQSIKALILADGTEVPPGLDVPLLHIGETFDTWAGQSATWPRLPFNHPLFILFSSGTTGPPKCIVHGAGGTLLEHVKEHRLHCNLRPDDRLFFRTATGWMMWNWQLSALAGGVEIVLQDGPPASAAQLWQIVSGLGVTVFGTSPAYLQMCERSATPVTAGLNFGALRAILSTGSILSPRQQDWVSHEVRRLPVQSISGGTDIIGCFVLGNPNLPAWSAVSQCRSLGMDVRALGAAKPDTCGYGELVCANPFPSRPIGFLHDPDGQLFHDAYFRQNPGYWTHGDLIEMTAEGGIVMHGRSDGVLNVRGVRIGPAEIYRILERIPEICDAMAVEQQSPGEIGGSRMVLLIVLKDGAALDDRLRATIRRELVEQGSPAHVPAVIQDVADLPTTYSGKRSETSARDALNGREAKNAEALRNPECLSPLRALALAAQRDGESASAPLQEAGKALDLEQVRVVWERLLGLGGLRAEDNFFDLGGDSLAALNLMAEIERLTGRPQPLTLLIRAPTLGAFTTAVTTLEQGSSSLLVLLRPGSGPQPLFIVHGYGGLVMELRPLAQQLDTSAPVYGIRASGFEAGEPVYARVEDMCRAYLAAIREIQPRGPYLIAGYSMGGLVAHEMARQLAAAGESLALLALIDTSTHEQYWPLSVWIEYYTRRAGYHLHRLSRRRSGGVFAEIFRLGVAMRRRIRGAAAVPVDTFGGAILPESVQRLRHAGLAAFAGYRPRWSPLRILLLRSDLRESTLCNPLIVWRRFSPAIEVLDVPGDHLSMIRPPHLQVLARQLSRSLGAALGPQHSPSSTGGSGDSLSAQPASGTPRPGP